MQKVGVFKMQELTTLLSELKSQSFSKKGKSLLLVVQHRVRCEKIGSVGSMEAAQEIFTQLQQVQEETGVSFAFQGCEHINRAITIERKNFNPLQWKK